MGTQQWAVPAFSSINDSDPETHALTWKEEQYAILAETAQDLRASNRDLRLVLGYLEQDAARLSLDLDLEKNKNGDLRAQIQASSQETRRLRDRIDILEELMELKEISPNFNVGPTALQTESSCIGTNIITIAGGFDGGAFTSGSVHGSGTGPSALAILWLLGIYAIP